MSKNTYKNHVISLIKVVKRFEVSIYLSALAKTKEFLNRFALHLGTLMFAYSADGTDIRY